MKSYGTIAIFVVCFAFANSAQAKIVNGNFEDLFTNLYATAPKNHTRLPEFNSPCNSAYESFLNTTFDEFSVHVVFENTDAQTINQYQYVLST